LLLEGDAAACECDVVIGGKQGDQAEDETADGLGQAEAVEADPVETEAAVTGPGAKR
jgi:hypothetical protein